MFAFLTKYRPGYAPAIGWFILSTFLLCMPGSRSPKYNWLLQIHFDKWVHVGLFGVLVVLACWGFWSRSKSNRSFSTPFALFTGLATAYGIGVEYLQDGFIPNRSFDLGDIWADAGGALVGGWFSLWRFGKK
ncbi:MAG: hypothetical protein RL750_974 [Bacteroidota bacterium]